MSQGSGIITFGKFLAILLLTFLGGLMVCFGAMSFLMFFLTSPLMTWADKLPYFVIGVLSFLASFGLRTLFARAFGFSFFKAAEILKLEIHKSGHRLKAFFVGMLLYAFFAAGGLFGIFLYARFIRDILHLA